MVEPVIMHAGSRAPQFCEEASFIVGSVTRLLLGNKAVTRLLQGCNWVTKLYLPNEGSTAEAKQACNQKQKKQAKLCPDI